MKKIIVLLFMLLIMFTVSCNDASKYSEYIDENHSVAVMRVEGFGKIIFQLDKENAPITVAHFTELANSGAYNGSMFIRYQEGFVLQGGSGCSDTSTIKGEFTYNGVSNLISHEVGVISLARSTDNDSGSCQFFIVTDDSAYSSLDGYYAGFGKVIDGWDNVEKICNSFDSDDFMDGYYGTYMGFLNESSYVKILSITVYE